MTKKRIIKGDSLTPLRVLIIEDSEEDAGRLVAELRQGGYEPAFQRIDSEEGLNAALADRTWQAVLCGQSLAQLNPADALEMLRTHELDLPFIVISSPIGEEAAADLLKAGAHDLILKGNGSRLVASVRRELREANNRKERRCGEENLRRVDERLKLALAASGMDMWEWDVVANRVIWSEGVHTRFGLAPNEFGGTYEAFLNLIYPQDRPLFMSALKSILEDKEEGNRFDFDLRIVRQDGEVRWLHFKSQVFRDDTGRPLRLLGIGMDITSRKESEDALRRSEERFEKTFRHSPAIMMISNLSDGKILDVNAAFPLWLGYAREEIIGRTDEDLGIWANAELRSEVKRRLAKEGIIQSLETGLVGKSGAILEGLCSFVSIEVEGATCLLAIILDLTEHKRIEQERARLLSQSQAALEKVKTLSGLLPICAHCRRIRDENGEWHALESYLRENSQLGFTQGYCPECATMNYPDLFRKQSPSPPAQNPV